MNRIVIKVKEIRGNCAVFKGGEKIVIEGAEINLKETDKICIHALPPLLHYVIALREGVDPVKLGLAKEGRKAYSRHKAKQKIELRRTLKIIIVLIIITQYSTYLSAISINISATEGYDKAERTGAKDKGNCKAWWS